MSKSKSKIDPNDPKIDLRTPNGGEAWTLDQLQAHVVDRVRDYEGFYDDLYRAIGMAQLGLLFGWQTVRICASYATVRKAEAALGLDFRDVMPMRTELARKVRGIRISDTLDGWWQILQAPASEYPMRQRAAVGPSDVLPGLV